MKEPTLKQAKHFLQLIDNTKVDLDQLEAAYKSGLLSIFLKADFAEIDKYEFMQSCGLLTVPKVGDYFKLAVHGIVRNFVLVLVPSRDNLENVMATMAFLGHKIPGSECLEAFYQKFHKADGYGPICLAANLAGGYPLLNGSRGEIWNRFMRRENLQTELRDRWFIEID